MNSFSVSLYLASILGVVVFLLKKATVKGASITVYWWLLFIMVSPGFVMDVQDLFFWGPVGIENLTLFFILLLLTTLPWLRFERWYKKIPIMEITPNGVNILSTVFLIVIISCLFSYIYIAPYALRSYAMGAASTRSIVNADESVLPSTIFTTFAVGVSSISPFYIFFFFLSLLHPALKKYSLWLFISSFIYIWVSMPFMARDGFVTLPIFFIIFYLIFRRSLGDREVKKVKKYFTVLAGVAGSLLLIYSISRFYSGKGGSGAGFLGLIDGTWGYIYQQPYVFDRTVTYQQSWHGMGLLFPVFAWLFGIPTMKVYRTEDFETMFGTMLSQFYSIGGYWSLFLFTAIFILIYYIALSILIRRRNIFSIFILFITYLMIEVTGLFYFRYGGATFNWLFTVLTILPFILNNKIITTRR